MRKKSTGHRTTELSRRQFLINSGLWTSAGLIAARGDRRAAAQTGGNGTSPLQNPGDHRSPLQELDDRLTPHYRQPLQFEEVLRHVEPGLDDFITEKYAEQIEEVLAKWTADLMRSPARFAAIEDSISPSLKASSLMPARRWPLRPLTGLEVYRNEFSSALDLGRDKFAAEFRQFVGLFANLATAEFKLTGISASGTRVSPGNHQTRVRYDLVGRGRDFFRGERVGYWDLEWESDSEGGWRVRQWQALGETESRAARPVFVDVTGQAFGSATSYQKQMLSGIDHWRTVLDGASRIDVYGNNGIAVGDIDGDGFDDVYVCQPSGLPNRLYRNRGDGTFEDVTEKAGVGVLDNSPCALFADLNNNGRQDLIVVTVDGPLLFLNQGGGRFVYKPDAFRFAQPPQGTFTGAALADYDGDGRLDIYFCLYSYYKGLSQYQYPTPYYDARNGPPKFLMHNQGDGNFADVTAATGLNANNNRYGFACGWCDFDHDGHPDLYVVNDFGRKNLYHNNGDGTFTDIAEEVGVLDIGPGMSCCWFDYDNDGNQDLYVCDMWEPAGMRVSMQDVFMKGAPENIRALYRRHAKGNSLFHNQGNGIFGDRSAAAHVEKAGWSWGCGAWDFDHDGYPDLYVATGMISGPLRQDLSSFFWRHVVSQSPSNFTPSPNYEKGWNAINELIRSDHTWAGYQRNVFYANNRNGTFSDVSGVLGLDFPQDSRSFALTDFDHDGRLELFLKNRSSPQLRILRNEMRDLGESVAFRLRGIKSNRDAIGAEISVECGGLRQTKFIQAGTGFLSQHTKDLYFGLGQAKDNVRATIRWPSGLVQQFENLPVGSLIRIEEGAAEFQSEAFRSFSESLARDPSPVPIRSGHPLPEGEGQGGLISSRAAPPTPASAPVETWLLAPVAAPGFGLPDIAGRERKLEDIRGRPLVLSFWRTPSPSCEQLLALFEQRHARWLSQGLQLVAINVNTAEEALPAAHPKETGKAAPQTAEDPAEQIRALARKKRYSFPILLATEEVAAVYNILYHYLFDRRRDLGLPTSFLIDAQGQIVKVYQGPLNAASVEADFRHIPATPAERAQKGLPFAGRLYGVEFQRNQFTYALVFMERGYPDQALASCRLALAREPENAEAHYLLGMIYLKKQMPKEARASFEQTLRSRPGQPDTFANAWNNLGMLAAQEGRADEAIPALQEAIKLNPGYTIALENLGNVYRQQHRWAEARSTLERALRTDPDDAGVNYSLAMTFAQQDDTAHAEQYFDAALKSRPDYPEAWNNLGILYLRTKRVSEGIKAFETCIRVAPAFDQAYISLARVYSLEGQKDRAADVLHQLLEQHPGHAQAQQLLKELGR